MKWPGFGQALVRSFGSALLIQATVSLGNFAASSVLIRLTGPGQFGYYVLVVSALLLLTTLQGAFIQAPMVLRMTRLDSAGRGDVIGGLLREQKQIMFWVVWSSALAAGVLWFLRALDGLRAALIVCGALAAAATLMREFFRMALFSYRRPQKVLTADICYVTLLLAAVMLAACTPAPVLVAVIGIAAAARVSSALLARALWTTECWNIRGAPGILRTLAPLGAWSVVGAGAHWALSQGYSYLVASLLSVQSVAAIAATRLVLMPLNLLSAGIGTQLFPLTADWVHRLGIGPTLHRLCVLSIGLLLFGGCYFALLWLVRVWVFASMLHQQFPQRDLLLALWFGVFALMLIRDQFVKLLAACERFPPLAWVTVASSVISLACSYESMLRWGEAGAVGGVLCGELVNVIGIVILTCRQIRRSVPVPA